MFQLLKCHVQGELFIVYRGSNHNAAAVHKKRYSTLNVTSGESFRWTCC